MRNNQGKRMSQSFSQFFDGNINNLTQLSAHNNKPLVGKPVQLKGVNVISYFNNF